MNIGIFAADGTKIIDLPFNDRLGTLGVPVIKQFLERSKGRISVRFDLPIINIHGYWTPDMMRARCQLDWTCYVESSIQKNFPCMSFFSLDGRNAFTVLMTCFRDDARITAQMDQEHAVYQMTLETAVTDSTEPFEIYFSFSSAKWHETVRSLIDSAVPRTNTFPPDAFKPVYCTWYAAHAALTMDYLDENARLAAEAGFGTFIVDDGWCFDEMKRVTPEALPAWYRDIGEWTVSEKKLPHFAEHVARARGLGLKYMLWTAPYFVGRRSSVRASVKPEEIAADADSPSNAVVNPTRGNFGADVCERLWKLVRDIPLDGLKIDFIDWLPSSMEKPESRAIHSFVKKLTDGIRAIKSDALIEFRQRYATPGMLGMATQFRAGDVPFDFMENFYRTAQIRLCLGNNVPCHADPVYFHPDESDLNVSRHMIASLAGVPMFSMDMRFMKASHTKIVKDWIAFYNEHIETFAHGAWSCDYLFETIRYLAVEGETEKIAIILDPSAPGDLAGKTEKDLYILNLSPLDTPECPRGKRFFKGK